MKKSILKLSVVIICLSMILCTFAGCSKVKELVKGSDGESKETTVEKTKDTPASKSDKTGKDSVKSDNTDVSDNDDTSNDDEIIYEETTASAAYPYGEGITVSDYQMIYLAETYNIEMKISNSLNEDTIVDFSKLSLKLNNQRELDESFALVKVGAGKNITCSMPIEGDTSDFSSDSFFTVFYDGKFVGRAPIEYFG